MSTDDEHRELLDAAGEQQDDAPSGDVPLCPECGRPVDDVSKMSPQQVLDDMQIELHRDLLRSLQLGTATHQEKAIIRGILRDNGKLTKEEPPGPGGRRGGRAKPKAEEEDYSWRTGDKDYTDTDGG